MNARTLVAVGAMALSLGLAACTNDASIVSKNLSTAADNFELTRRIVFYNGITNDYMLVIEGRCSLEQTANKLAVTCQAGPSTFKKHFLGLSDNVTYFSEQIESASVSKYFYRVVWKPTTIVPDIDVR